MKMVWKRAWAYCPLDFSSTPFEIENEIQVIELPINSCGEAVRIRLSNLYGSMPLRFSWIRLNNEEGTAFTFAGREYAEVLPGQTLLSDPLHSEIRPDRPLTVVTCVREKTTVDCVCSFCTEKAARVSLSDADTGAVINPLRSMTAQDPRCRLVYGLCEAEVLCPDTTATIVAFGDSITHMSFWTGEIQRRLQNRFPGRGNIINLGIGGNRILRDTPEAAGLGALFGEAGIRRYEAEVFHGDETAVLVLEGVNDLWHPYAYQLPQEICAAEELAKGLESYAKTAAAHGIPAWCGTVMPFGGLETATQEMEHERNKLNAWLRSSACFTGILDYDMALRDAADPLKLDPMYDSGDHLHPNPAGGKRMADIIPMETILGTKK